MKIGSLSGSLTRLVDDTSYLIAGTNITIVSESNGAITISSTGGGGGGGSGDDFFDSTTAGSIFTSGSAAFVGVDEFGVVESPLDKGPDVFFYVSGAIGSKDTVIPGVALFGGDVVVSGSLTLPSDAIELTGSLLVTGKVEVTGTLEATQGLSGSLTKLVDGTSYLIAGTNITITSQSNGSVTISNTFTQTDDFFDSTVQGSIYTSGSAAFVGAGEFGVVTSPTDKAADVFFYVSGSIGSKHTSVAGTALFGGDVTVSGSFYTDGNLLEVQGKITATEGISGSLTQLVDGTSYLIAGQNISISSQSNGSITISNTFQQVDDFFDSTVAGSIFTTGSTAFKGQESITSPQDKGTDVFFYVSGSIGSKGGTDPGVAVFEGDVVISGSVYTEGNKFEMTGTLEVTNGISGSLTKLVDGTSYLIAGQNISISSQSNGPITISNTFQQVDDFFDSTTAGTIFTTGSTAFKGQESIDSPSDKGTDVFFYVSGSIGSRGGTIPGVALFGGDVVISGSTIAEGNRMEITGTLEVTNGISGSLTKLVDGTSYIVAGNYISVVSQSNGSITISGVGIAPLASQYVTIGNDSTLTNERSLSAGTGLLLTDAGANSTVTLGINNSIVATVSGTTFTGATNHSAGLSGSLTKLTNGSSYLIAGTNISISSASNGSVTITNTFKQVDDFFDSTTAGSIFTTGSAAFRGQESIDSPSDKGTDVFFYVSGSNGAKNGTIPAVTLFGGDVVISGTLHGGSPLKIGTDTQITGSLSQGLNAVAFGAYSQAQGTTVRANDDNAHAEGNNTLADAVSSHAEGSYTTAFATGAHSEGLKTYALGPFSHAEGHLTTGSGDYSHAEGGPFILEEPPGVFTNFACIANGNYSHVEGLGTETNASAVASHAEGYRTTTTGSYSHAEGDRSISRGNYSHAEGSNTFSIGAASHAEGEGTIAEGIASHAEGLQTKAYGSYSHASGLGTVASGSYQTTIGKYNVADSSTNTLFIVGNGTSNVARSDVLKVTTTDVTINQAIDFNANGTDSLVLDQVTSNATTTLSTNPLYWRKTVITTPHYWAAGITSGNDLQFNYGTTTSLTALGYLSNTAVANNVMNFTGQHRCVSEASLTSPEEKVGLIVKSSGVIVPLSGSVMSINDATPTVLMTTSRNDKAAFGVISEVEDTSDGKRTFSSGMFVTIYEADPNDSRVFINSLGEGCIWVCNINGNIENGDYITTCEIPGHGMKQDDDLLHNYTVAKSTMNCNFDLNSSTYKCEEFVYNGTTYRKAFISCTYHCG